MIATDERRRAASYSIVDHELLHGGYLHRLSHQAMALYLFLVVVGNREGRSFYGEATISGILRFTGSELRCSIQELAGSGLVEYRRPYFHVKNLAVRRRFGGSTYGRDNKKDTVHEGRPKALISSDRERDWHTSKEGVKALLRQLGG